MKTNKPKDILVFALGPIQSFIENARRTQDLAAGSRILSELAQAAMQAAESNSGQHIYPQKINGRWPDSLPNRMVIAVPQGAGKKVAVGMETSVRLMWNQGISGKTFLKFQTLTRQNNWRNKWTEQIGEWLELYWVVVPWDGQDTTYTQAYRWAGLALDARKNLRHYSTYPQPGRKCTLCSIRSALDERESFWKPVQQKIGRSVFRTNERLCAICAVKRLSPRTNIPGLSIERFPSTSSIASASFRATLLEHWDVLGKVTLSHLDALDTLNLSRFSAMEPSQFLQTLAGNDPDKQRLLKYDGDTFYRDFFTEKRVEENQKTKASPLSRKDKKLLQTIPTREGTLGKLLKAVAEAGEKRSVRAVFPPTYYAILKMDGDHMGKLLDETANLEVHENISRALAQAAQQMREIVEIQHPGQLIYSGGDDALALLPVDCAIQVADKLRLAFGKTLENAGIADCHASAGAAIIHHSHPLEGALQAAREAEKTAKNTYGRNALVVRLLKRSGEEWQTGREWPETAMIVENGSDAPPPDPIEEARWRIAADHLASKFPYDLKTEVIALAGTPTAACSKELARLLQRHRNPGKWDDAGERVSLAERLAELADTLPVRTDIVRLGDTRIETKNTGIEQLADWLLVARFLAQGGYE